MDQISIPAILILIFPVYRYIVGLVSLGRDSRDDSCGSEALPSMYTDLTYFRKWIMHNIEELESISTKTCEGQKQLHKLKDKKMAGFGDTTNDDC